MQERRNHILEPTKQVRRPERMIFFDSESRVQVQITDEEIYRAAQGKAVRKAHTPYLVCATFMHRSRSKTVHRERKYYLTRKLGNKRYPEGSRDFLFDFWRQVDHFTRMDQKTYMFAHNAKYDVQVTGGLTYLIKLGYTVKSFSDANPFFLVLEKEITHSPRYGTLYKKPKKKTIVILSSTNYYAAKLADLGKVFGIAKLDFNHDEPFTMGAALTYCQVDVDILEKAMLSLIDFIEREEFGSFGYTIASQAFSAYRAKYMPEETIHIHTDERALEIEREAYAGGRTECFRMGEMKEKTFYVDVNSMYAHVMRQFLYPSRLVSRWESCSVPRLRELIMDDYLVCARVRVNTEVPAFHKKDKRLVFPIGDFWTTLCTPEIIYGLENGLITEVADVCLYEAADLFTEYVDYFYTKRLKSKQAKDAIHDLLYKNFLTNLYGKFGQRSLVMEKIGDCDPEVIGEETFYSVETRKRRTFKYFGGHVWEQQDDGKTNEAVNSFPAIAAHVTAYARMLLLEAYEVAGWENLMYSDTDSIMCNEQGYLNLKKHGYLNNSVLGKLKLESVGRVTLHGCKDYEFYQFPDKKDLKKQKAYLYTKIKGVNKSAVLISPDDKKINRELGKLADNQLRFAVTQWGGFSKRFKEKDFSNYHNTIIIKTLKREYNKGIIIGDRVVPYKLNYAQEISDAFKESLAPAVRDDLLINDPILFNCQAHGYIAVPVQGERYYGEYKKLNAVIKRKYFRLNRSIQIDEWCDIAGMSVRDLFDELNTGRIF